MMLKIVYGPPPADAERIEAAEQEEESCIREQEAPVAAPPIKTPDA
ncbi:hypothetical protein [Sporomusa sphaeroides]|uniref:Uncharacterized protein n=1 Tax=Sporomusa sphaeroides DSM 2875 TaxID=1337886 RepID=A0ABM9W9W2_9FIRM|nr:hypothetical protein [Sporomusa sphaeroides]OLS54256.1 hypothetical protein SPSPH_46280 [Sporomusa sphaeroides DSM 2875]CVK21882.1 hypothetical protein SSPH_04601 [Sporomusa sphaeroides DSM 2875]